MTLSKLTARSRGGDHPQPGLCYRHRWGVGLCIERTPIAATFVGPGGRMDSIGAPLFSQVRVVEVRRADDQFSKQQERRLVAEGAAAGAPGLPMA
jgi:hypothetical protein